MSPLRAIRTSVNHRCLRVLALVCMLATPIAHAAIHGGLGDCHSASHGRAVDSQENAAGGHGIDCPICACPHSTPFNANDDGYLFVRSTVQETLHPSDEPCLTTRPISAGVPRGPPTL